MFLEAASSELLLGNQEGRRPGEGVAWQCGDERGHEVLKGEQEKVRVGQPKGIQEQGHRGEDGGRLTKEQGEQQGGLKKQEEAHQVQEGVQERPEKNQAQQQGGAARKRSQANKEKAVARKVAEVSKGKVKGRHMHRHTRTHAHTHTCTHTFMQTSTLAHTHITRIHKHTNTHAYIRTHKHTHTHTRTHTYIRTHKIHTYPHAHTLTHMQQRLEGDREQQQDLEQAPKRQGEQGEQQQGQGRAETQQQLEQVETEVGDEDRSDDHSGVSARAAASRGNVGPAAGELSESTTAAAESTEEEPSEDAAGLPTKHAGLMAVLQSLRCVCVLCLCVCVCSCVCVCVCCTLSQCTLGLSFFSHPYHRAFIIGLLQCRQHVLSFPTVLREHATKRLAELATAQLQLLLDHGLSLSSAARWVGW